MANPNAAWDRPLRQQAIAQGQNIVNSGDQIAPGGPFSGILNLQRPADYSGGAAGALMNAGGFITGNAMGNVLGTANNFGGMMQGAMDRMGGYNLANQRASLHNRLISALSGSVPGPLAAPQAGVGSHPGSIYSGPPTYNFGAGPSVAGVSGAQRSGLTNQIANTQGQEAGNLGNEYRQNAIPQESALAMRSGIANQGFSLESLLQQLRNTGAAQADRNRQSGLISRMA